MANTSESTDLSESATIPQDFIIEPVNERKFEGVLETNEIEDDLITIKNVDKPEVEKQLDKKVVQAVVHMGKSETKPKEKRETRELKRKAKEMKSENDSKPEDKATPASKKQKLEVDLTNPNILKPFDFGWKREVVYRNVNKGKTNCDIYYYTPASKKFRSMREVEQNLTNDLTIENFTFSKKQLGLDDPMKEIVRNANTKFGVQKKSTPKPIKNSGPKKEGTVTTPKVIVTTTPLQRHPVRMSTRESSKNKQTKEKNNNIPEVSELEVRKTRKLIEADNFFENAAVGYKMFLEVFKYLEVKDLLNAGRVSKVWNLMANNQSLWKIVRLKNFHLRNWKGIINMLKKNRTIHLDLCKIVLPSNVSNDVWDEFTTRIKKVKTLRKIYLCRCPSQVVEQLCVSNPELELINATRINSESIEMGRLASLQNLQELHLKSISSCILTSDLNALTELTQLKHLSLTSISNLNQLNLNVIGNLTNLKSLSLGKCVDLPQSFTKDVLSKLESLEQLRLEKGEGNCNIIEILAEVKNLKYLEQLELINCDLKTGFDRALKECTNIKKLLVIPNYTVHSSLTCHMILRGVIRLQPTLTHFVWGITRELIKTTQFLDIQYNTPQNKKKNKLNNTKDSIAILKPVPNLENHMEIFHAEDKVQIVSLSELRMILLKNVPNTQVKILKIPFRATWKQSLQAC